MVVFHCTGNAAREVWCEDGLRRKRGRSGPAMRNGTGEIPSGTGLWDGLAYFVAALCQRRMTGGGGGVISECRKLWGMKLEERYAMNTSAMCTVDCMHTAVKIMKLGLADELRQERALKMWEILGAGISDRSATFLIFRVLAQMQWDVLVETS